MGLLDGLFGGGGGLLNYSPQPDFLGMPPQQQGFLGGLTNALGSPLVGFGLGLASGRTPQQGFANALEGYNLFNKQRKADEERRMSQQSAYDAAIAQGATPAQARSLAMNPEAFGALQPKFHTLTGLFSDQTPIFVSPFGKITEGSVGGGGQAGGGTTYAQNGQGSTPSGGALPNLPENYDENGKDWDFLKAIEQKYGTVASKSIQDVSEGKIPAMGRNLQKLIPLASRFDKNFTGMQDYQTRLGTAKSFASGKDAETVKSYNQAITHADQAWDLIPKIENFNVGGMLGKVINTPAGEYRSATDPQYALDRKRYENLVNALSGELMKASRGSGSGSLEEIRSWRSGAMAANSGDEMRGSIQGAMDFLHGAMEASARKKSEGMKSQFGPIDLLSEGNKGAFNRIRDYSSGGKSSNTSIPDSAAKALKANPDKADEFDRKYGRGSASRILGRE